MSEPVKPFACALADCGMTFTNEDHLHVHTKKHDMVLQLGSEQKAAFVADQTPTPTRFIRNCEEVGLFQDLQNVAANPFDEGFKRAMESKAGILSLETITPSSDDVLHTPQMVFPLLDGTEPTHFNGQRNVTISRSSSDESGTIKEFETRTISKLTNEVTTISRIVNTDDVTITSQTDVQKDVETVSYKNNVIRIESNIIRKDVNDSRMPVLVYTDSAKRAKDIIDVDTSKLHPEKLPIMSQKSIDFVVDSLTSELETNVTQNIENVQKTKNDCNISNNEMVTITRVVKKKITPPKRTIPRIMPKTVKTNQDKFHSNVKAEDYEVVIKLPGGKQVRMKPVVEPDPKQVIRNRITRKIDVIKNNNKKPVPTYVNKQSRDVHRAVHQASAVNIPAGTLIPVTLVNQEGTPLTDNDLNKVPITKITDVSDISNISLSAPVLNKIPSKTNNANSNILVVNKRKVKCVLIPRESPKLDVKVSEPYQIVDNNTKDSKKTDEIVSPKAPETICLTEEDVANKIKENNKKENNLTKEQRKSIDEDDDDCVMVDEVMQNPASAKRQRIELERRCAASKRYRERLKYAMRKQSEENRQLRESNQRMIAEKAVLKLLITEHMKRCPNAGDIADRLSMLTNGGSL